MQRLQFESSPFYILICIAIGIIYAVLLYKRKHSWSKTVNWVLFSLRTIVVTLVALLLLNPIMKFINNTVEKPSVVFLVDNSASVKEILDSTKLKQLDDEILKAKAEIQKVGYDVIVKDFSGKAGSLAKGNYLTSDLTSALKSVDEEFDGKNLAQIVLVSDGIYNSGVSPLFTPFRIPINTIGVGDTSQRKDIILKNLAYNKIAYQGNQYPLHAEILVKDLLEKEVNVSVYQGGRKIASQKQVAKTPLLIIPFQLPANEKGLKRIDVEVEPIEGEANIKNNRASAYIEVIEGKKKILLVAPAPHPDIKALRSVIEKNNNYELTVYIPNSSKLEIKSAQQIGYDLIIYHQLFDRQNQTLPIWNRLAKASSGILYVVGEQSNLFQLRSSELPLKFDNLSQRDEVTPSLNNLFKDFAFSENVATQVLKYPPISVPFGKINYPANASILLYQRIGSVITDRPLVLTYDDKGNKVAVIMGDGFWQWRLSEYAETEKTEAFDEIFSKLIQYLSSREDKRRFKSFPIANEFTEADQIIFESQVFNELFEPIYGNTIQLELSDDKGKITPYNYIISKEGARYKIGNLKEGVYSFKAFTTLSGKQEIVRGEFLVSTQNIETQSLVADFNLLKKLSDNSGGKFNTAENIHKLIGHITSKEAQSIIHSEATFNPLINLKWVFFLLVALISTEWFLRKYLGGY